MDPTYLIKPITNTPSKQPTLRKKMDFNGNALTRLSLIDSYYRIVLRGELLIFLRDDASSFVLFFSLPQDIILFGKER